MVCGSSAPSGSLLRSGSPDPERRFRDGPPRFRNLLKNLAPPILYLREKAMRFKDLTREGKLGDGSNGIRLRESPAAEKS